MKGKSALFWLGLTAVAGGVLFQTSYEAQSLEEELASINRKIVAEQETIQVLKAEWSYLNEPGSLEELARTHLSLRPTEAKQFIASLDVIPLRPVPAVAPAPDTLPAVGGASARPLPPVASATPPAPTAAPATASVRNKAVLPAAAPAKSAPARPKGPTELAAKPATAKPSAQPSTQQLAAKPLALPSNRTSAKPAAAAPAAPGTDSMGVLIARLGSTR